ncbi:MAG: RNA polymerase sigma factor [Bacteriovoracia bacterium]
MTDSGDKTDDELMLLVARGQFDSLSVLVKRHSPVVRGYSARLLGRAKRDHLEDICQITWTKVISAAAGYTPTGKFRSWLLTIARNSCFDLLQSSHDPVELKKNYDESEEAAIEQVADDSREDIESVLAQIEDIALIREAVDALPETQRRVITLWMSDEMSVEEAAAALKLKPNAFYVNLSRAKAALTKALKAKSGGERK